MVNRLIFVLIIIISFSCSKSSKEEMVDVCKITPGKVIIPFIYNQPIKGTLYLYYKNSNQLYKKKDFDITGGASLNDGMQETSFHLKEIRYCYDIVIEIKIYNHISIHKFSDFIFEEENIGNITVYKVVEYKYNNNIYYDHAGDFILREI